MKKILFALYILTFTLKAQTYVQSTVVSGLNYPVAFDIAPDGRFFATQKGGNSGMAVDAYIKVYSSTGTFLSNFYNLSDSCNSDFERGLLGIELDPDFTNNQYVYVYYNHNYNGDERIRIVRFTEVSNVGTNPTIIFDLDVSNSIAGNHVGGNLHFRPSEPGIIYFTIGDLAYQQGNASLNYANKITNPYGKILRINRDGSIPTDNPFYDDGNPLSTNCDWIWSYGHRNPFDFCFNKTNDTLYCSENGWNTWDEVSVIRKGGNYGWATCEGNYLNSSTTNLCNLSGDVLPITTWGSPLPAITGILFYEDNDWPALNKHLLIADNDYGRIYDCTMGNAPAYDIVNSKVQLGDLTTSGGLTTLRKGNDSCFYAMKGGYTTSGVIYRVCPPATTGMDNYSVFNDINVFPVPAYNEINISFNCDKTGSSTVKITDIQGKSVMNELIEVNAGYNEVVIKNIFTKLGKGLYFLTIRHHDSEKISKPKKIIIAE
jgi:glucose/arabinose dehydrogenase